MNIEIFPDEYRKGVLQLFVGEDFFREIHASIFGKTPKFSFSPGGIAEQFAEIEFKRAHDFALKRLAQRSYSSFELRGQLAERLISSGTVDRVIGECRRLGWIDDVAWIENYIRLQKSKKVGPQMIASKLGRKKVPRTFYAPFLEEGLTVEEQQEGVRRLLETRFRSKDLSDYKERRKVLGALMRKGYDFDVVNAALQSRS